MRNLCKLILGAFQKYFCKMDEDFFLPKIKSKCWNMRMNLENGASRPCNKALVGSHVTLNMLDAMTNEWKDQEAESFSRSFPPMLVRKMLFWIQINGAHFLLPTSSAGELGHVSVRPLCYFLFPTSLILN